MKTQLTIALIGLIILLICFTSQGQYKYEQQRLKAYIPSATLVFASGVFKELRDASIFYRFKTNDFWDGRNSWKRKYKDGDYRQGPAYFGSTSFLVWTTDNVHFSQMMYGQCDAWALCLAPYDPNKRFWHLLLKVAAKTAIETLGRGIVYMATKNGNR